MPKEVSEVISAIVAAIIVLVILISFIITFLIVYYRRYHRHQYEKQQLQARHEQDMLKSELETLQNVSQEIHDNVGQVLSLARLNLGALDVNKPSGLEQQIGDVENLLGKAMFDLQRLAKGMNPGYVQEMGLIRCIEYELETIRKSGKFYAQLELDGDMMNKLREQEEIILFRIVQEVINNIIKHAEATSISIYANCQAEAFSLRIIDNGKGFDTFDVKKGKENSSGLGIRNMQTRAKLIGANLLIDSSPGNGTLVTICLPLNQR